MSVLKVYLNWATSVLENTEFSKLVTFEEILKGKVLCQLIDVFRVSPENTTGLLNELPESCDAENYIRRVLNHFQSRNIKFDFTASDILKGNIKSILDLLWRIILNYCIHDNESDFTQHNSVSAGRKLLQSWCQQVLPEVKLDTRYNLVKSLCSTDYFSLLLESISTVQLSASHKTNKVRHLESLLENIEAELGIKKDIVRKYVERSGSRGLHSSLTIVNVCDILNGSIDEQILMIYLALLKWKVKRRSKVSSRYQVEYLSPHKAISTITKNYYCYPTTFQQTPTFTSNSYLYNNTNTQNTSSSHTQPTFSPNTTIARASAVMDVNVSPGITQKMLSSPISRNLAGGTNIVYSTVANNTQVSEIEPATRYSPMSSISQSQPQSSSNKSIQIINKKAIPVISVMNSPSPIIKNSSCSNTCHVSTVSATSPVMTYSSPIIKPLLSSNNMSTSDVNSFTQTTLKSSSITKQRMVSTFVLPTVASSTVQKPLTNTLKLMSSPPSLSAEPKSTPALMVSMSTEQQVGPVITCSSLCERNYSAESPSCRNSVLTLSSNPYVTSDSSWNEITPKYSKTINKVTPLCPRFLSCSTIELSRKPVLGDSENNSRGKNAEKYRSNDFQGATHKKNENPLQIQISELSTINTITPTGSSGDIVNSSPIMSPIINAPIKIKSSQETYSNREDILGKLSASASQNDPPYLSFEGHSLNQSLDGSMLSENQMLWSKKGMHQGYTSSLPSLSSLTSSPPPLLSPPQYLPTFLPFKLSNKLSGILQSNGCHEDCKNSANKNHNQSAYNRDHDSCSEAGEHEMNQTNKETLNSQAVSNESKPSVLTTEKIEYLCEEIGKLKDKVSAMETDQTSSNSTMENTAEQIHGHSSTDDNQLVTQNFDNADIDLNVTKIEEQNRYQPLMAANFEHSNPNHQNVVSNDKHGTDQITLEQPFQSADDTTLKSNKIQSPNKSNSPSFSSKISTCRRGHLWKHWTRSKLNKTIDSVEYCNSESNSNDETIPPGSNSAVNKTNQQNSSSQQNKISSPHGINSTNDITQQSLNTSHTKENCEDFERKARKPGSSNDEPENSVSNKSVANTEVSVSDQHFKETVLKVIPASTTNQEFQNLLEKYTCFKENISDRIYLILKDLKNENENLKENLELKNRENSNLVIEVEKMESLKKFDVERVEQESQTNIERADFTTLQNENILLKKKLETVQQESLQLNEDLLELKDYQKGVQKLLNELQEQVKQTEHDKQVLTDELTLLWRVRKALRLSHMGLEEPFNDEESNKSRSYRNINEASLHGNETYKPMAPTTSSPSGQTLFSFPFHLSPVIDGRDRNLKCPDTPRLYRAMSYLNKPDTNHLNHNLHFPQNVWPSKGVNSTNFENKWLDNDTKEDNIPLDCDENRSLLTQQNKYQRLYWSDQHLDRLHSDLEISNVEGKHRLSPSSLPSENKLSSFEEPLRSSGRQRMNNVTFNFTQQTQNKSIAQGSALKGILKNVRSTFDDIKIGQSLSKSDFTNFPRKVRSVPSSPQTFRLMPTESLRSNSEVQDFLSPLNSSEPMDYSLRISKQWNSQDFLSSSSKSFLYKNIPGFNPRLSYNNTADFYRNNSKKTAEQSSFLVNKSQTDNSYFEWGLKKTSPDLKPLFGNPKHPRWIHTPYNFFLANTKQNWHLSNESDAKLSSTNLNVKSNNEFHRQISQDNSVNISEKNTVITEQSRTPSVSNQPSNLKNTSKIREFSNTFSPEQIEYSPNPNDENNTIVRNLCAVFESSDLSFDSSEPGSARKIRSWYDLDRNSPTKLTQEQRQYADRLIEKYTKLPSEK